jgi:acyl-CoA thioester hydrolase
MNSRFTISTEVKARFSDTDAMGHVNNSRYISFLEEGRVAYLRSLWPEKMGGAVFDSIPLILADIQCSFLAPIQFYETLLVGIGVTELGNKSFVFEYEIHERDSSRLVAKGRSVQVMYDYRSGKSIPLPEDFKERIRQRDHALLGVPKSV